MCRELASFDVSEVRREVLEIGEMQLFFFVVRRELVSNKTTRKRRARTCGNADKKKKEACCVPAHASRTPSHGSGREPMRRYLREGKKIYKYI